MKSLFPALILILILSACGKKSSSKKNSVQKQEALQGTFVATFVPVNMPEVWEPRGVAKLVRIEDNMSIVVAMRDVTEATHYQSIHLASRCPNDLDDKNFDGYVDSQELYQAVGKVLIPLDGDLNSQESGKDIFPSQNYRYEKNFSYSLMLDDLKQTDPDSSDDVIKLGKKKFSLNNLVVIIYGVPEYYSVPESVMKRNGYSVQASLPIACGKLSSSSEIPAEPDVSNPVPEIEEETLPPAPTPAPAPSYRPTIRSRIMNAWRGMWCRIRGNCSASIDLH